MSTPAIIYIVITAMGLGISMQQHGQPKTGKHSLWVSLFAIAIMATLLYLGGFFNGGSA